MTRLNGRGNVCFPTAGAHFSPGTKDRRREETGERGGGLSLNCWHPTAASQVTKQDNERDVALTFVGTSAYRAEYFA